MADLHYRSRDYCHAPLGVSSFSSLVPRPLPLREARAGGARDYSFSFSIQNVWEMTTLVDKVASRSCTACPPAIVLRLFIADTTISATLQCIANALKLFVRGKNTANSTARIAEQRLDRIKTVLHDLYFDS